MPSTFSCSLPSPPASVTQCRSSNPSQVSISGGSSRALWVVRWGQWKTRWSPSWDGCPQVHEGSSALPMWWSQAFWGPRLVRVQVYAASACLPHSVRRFPKPGSVLSSFLSFFPCSFIPSKVAIIGVSHWPLIPSRAALRYLLPVGWP